MREGAVFVAPISVRKSHERRTSDRTCCLKASTHAEETTVYEPEITSGVFSYSTHAAVVSVDPETGDVALENYAVAEDCGTVVNPDCRRPDLRGVAQGIGTALFEEIPYDEYGQPQASTFADYHWPDLLAANVDRAHGHPIDGTEYE